LSDYLERLFSLAGKAAIVTGGTRGIGAAIAEALHGAGARVLAVGRNAPAKAIDGIAYAQCDVRNDDAFRSACDAFAKQPGRLDVLVNAAGVTLAAGDTTDQMAAFAAFDLTLDGNLRAVYRCCATAIPHMKRAGGGSIINITSINSVLGFPDNPGYVAAKGGLRMLTKALARDLAASNIRVNNIAPGYIRTAMTEVSYADPAKNAERCARMMIPRYGEPHEIGGAAVYLASPAASYVTGIDLFVDGGWTAKGL
jgi:NAD(P)-dependent dehydrogenase (short-subunit alcohol dehydrogenase family)